MRTSRSPRPAKPVWLICRERHDRPPRGAERGLEPNGRWFRPQQNRRTDRQGIDTRYQPREESHAGYAPDSPQCTPASTPPIGSLPPRYDEHTASCPMNPATERCHPLDTVYRQCDEMIAAARRSQGACPARRVRVHATGLRQFSGQGSSAGDLFGSPGRFGRR